MILTRTPRPQTRLEWLAIMTDHLCPLVEQVGLTLPRELHVEYDLVRYETEHNKVLGQCMHRDHCADGRPQIYISPELSDSITIGGVILHELLHAALPAGIRHDKPFGEYALLLGLRGPGECTTVGPTLKKHIKFLISTIGSCYPSEVPPKSNPLKIPASIDYPRMLFHRTRAPVVVQSKSEEEALGDEWNRVIWPEDGSTPRSIDWTAAWLLSEGFPKVYYHRDTKEKRIVRDPREEQPLEDSYLWWRCSQKRKKTP